MSEKLQQAIAATRIGDTRGAQQLLADELEENPNNEHAWFLLGNLVDSPEKRKAYLGQALAINPQNQKAKQQYSQVRQQIAAAPIIARSASLTVAPTDHDAADMPDWLEDQLDDDSSDDDILEGMNTLLDESEPEAKAEVVETAVSIVDSSPAKPNAQTDREKQLRLYNYILAILVILILGVLITLIIS